MIDLLVIQPTPFCNIDCSYCYLPARHNTKKISLETISRITDHVLAERLTDGELSIVWHAGEPLTVPVDYFSSMLTLIEQRLKGIRIRHSIQTNGMLINQKWCDLFKRFDVRIGISIDGPKEINDLHRITRAGQGTFEKTMQGVAFLKLNNIAYHAIAVITKDTLDQPDKFFDFFKENGFYHLGLNVEETEGINHNSSLNDNSLDEKIEQFFKRLFKRYVDSDRSMGIREFDNSFNALLRQTDVADITKVKIYSHQTAPLGIVTVDYEGNFSTFSPELLGQQHHLYGDFNLGNVHQTGLKGIIKSRKFKNILSDIEKGITRCKRECEYFHVCGGGAPSNKLYENGSFDSTATMYCKYTVKTPIDIVLNYLENSLNVKSSEVVV